jgi:creatinine amidohydrolase
VRETGEGVDRRTASAVEAELATAEKGRQVYEEAVKQLLRFVTWFKDRPKDVRRDRHRTPPTMPMPRGQSPVR